MITEVTKSDSHIKIVCRFSSLGLVKKLLYRTPLAFLAWPALHKERCDAATLYDCDQDRCCPYDGRRCWRCFVYCLARTYGFSGVGVFCFHYGWRRHDPCCPLVLVADKCLYGDHSTFSRLGVCVCQSVHSRKSCAIRIPLA